MPPPKKLRRAIRGVFRSREPMFHFNSMLCEVKLLGNQGATLVSRLRRRALLLAPAATTFKRALVRSGGPGCVRSNNRTGNKALVHMHFRRS